VNGSLATMVRVQLRTGWLGMTIWVIALAATMAFTVSAIQGLYDTPAKVHSYAAAVQGNALEMINGKIAGIASLGGIVANEFGFIASFAIPFMAVALIAKMTRKDEETGRLELVLTGRIDRVDPLRAAMLVTFVAAALVTAALFASLAAAGVPTADGALYALSLGALGLVFLGVAAVAAQLVEHARGVYAIGLGAILAAYLLRGLGDVAFSPLTWLSPLGWQEQTRAFGDQRWWPLLVPVAVFALLAGAALAVASRRDVGSALLGVKATEPHASAFLRTPLGITLRAHRGSLIGWTTATILISATFGSVAKPLVDAINGNPSLASAIGSSGATGLDSVLAMNALVLALLAAGYAVQGVGVLRGEETSGRLEPRLCGELDRWGWLSTQIAVVALGIAGVSVLGGGVLALSTSASMGRNVTGQVAGAVVDFLPAIAFFGALGVLFFGVAPRWVPAVWLAYAAGAGIAYLGDSLNLPGLVQALSPFHLIGNPPIEPVHAGHVAVLAMLTAACLGSGYAAFRRRNIPHS
jgi:ABC-2 type transport system permease protein